MRSKVALIAAFVCASVFSFPAFSQSQTEKSPPNAGQTVIVGTTTVTEAASAGEASPTAVATPLNQYKPLPPQPAADLTADPYASIVTVKVATNPEKELLGKWKAAQDDSERNKITAQLQDHLKKQFQDRAAKQEDEIAQLEAKVKQLREKLELRRKKQDDIIHFRLEQLFREAEGLGWGTEDGRQMFIVPDVPASLR